MEDTENTKKNGFTVATVRVPRELYEQCQMRMVRTRESFQQVLVDALERYAAGEQSVPVVSETPDAEIARKVQILLTSPRGEVDKMLGELLIATLKLYR